MWVRSHDGKLVEILRKDFINNEHYYQHLCLLLNNSFFTKKQSSLHEIKNLIVK
jgi:hypothetical protein